MRIPLNNKILHIIIILIVTFLVYINTIPNEFVVDDVDFIVNWQSTRSLDNIPQFFKGELPRGHTGVYRPLRSLFYAVSYKLWLINPVGYHFQAIVVHMVITLLIYLIAIRFSTKIIAFMTALLFGVHPVHTENISFITTSFDMIGVLFFFLSFYYYLKIYERSRIKYYIYSIIFALLAFFTYEFTLILPVVVILYDVLFKRLDLSNIRNRKYLRNAIFYIIFFAGVIVYLFIRFVSLNIAGRGTYLADSFYHTQLTMAKAYIKYIMLTIFPINQAFIHQISEGITAFAHPGSDPAPVLAQSLFDFHIILSIILLLIIFATAIMYWKKQPLISFCILWFFIGLAPVAYIIPQAAIMGEKYLYISSFGFVLLFSFLLYHAYNKLKQNKDNKDNNDNKELNLSKALRIVIILLFVFFLVFYSSKTVIRNQDWKDDFTFWSKALRDNPESAVVNDNLGQIYFEMGEPEKARELYHSAINISPNFAFPHNNLGTYYHQQGNSELALRFYEKALELNPNLEFAYANIGTLYQEQGELDKAINMYEQAILIYPIYDDALYNIGLTYHKMQNIDKAIFYYVKTIQANPEFADAYYNLGYAYHQKEEYKLAVDNYARYINFRPDDPTVYFNLGLVYHIAQKPEDALQAYQKALSLKPDFAKVYVNLGMLYRQFEDFDAAKQMFEKALEIEPENEAAALSLAELSE